MGCLFKPRYTKNGQARVSQVWWVQYRSAGRRIRESTGTRDKPEAQRFLRRREGAAVDGKPITPRVEKIRVNELAQDLVNDYRANERPSIDRLHFALQRLLPFFGEMRAVQVSPAEVSKYVAQRQESGMSNGTINRELVVLRRMFNLAQENEKLHRVPKVKTLREDNIRQGFFEDEAFQAVLKLLAPEVQPVVTFAYLTGWRVQSEVLPLTWAQVDFKGEEVRLEPGTTKNREGRTFPLFPELRALLDEQRAYTDHVQQERGIICPFVFHRDGEQIKTFRRAWSTACKKAGHPGRILHDFRRTAVRNMVRAGVPERVAMALTGHKTRSVFDRYNIVSEGDLREAGRKLTKVVQEPVQAKDFPQVRSRQVADLVGGG